MKTGRVQQLILVAVVIATVSFYAINPAEASGFNQFVGLGDSTLDSGYFRYHSMGTIDLGGGIIIDLDLMLASAIENGANGGFAGNGVMVTTILAEKFGLNALPIDGGGTNYANGGALTAPFSDPAVLPANVPLTTQISQYLESVDGVANPDALYVISSGNNDLSVITDTNVLNQQSSALATSVLSLQNSGARYLLVPNSFRYANLVSLGGEITDAENAAEYTRLTAYNTQRWVDLASAGVHFIPADLDSVFKYVARNPTSFGFTPSSSLATSSPSAVSAVFSVITEEQQQTYLFVDGKHLTTAGQKIEADYEYSLLTAPSNIALLAETAIQGSLSRSATIQRQVELSGQNRGSKKINGWISAGYEYSKNESDDYFPNTSGNPFQGTIGVDYQAASGIIFGGALTVDFQSQDFSTGGDYDQDSQAVSLYAAYQADQFWGNIVASYGFLQNDIHRDVKLGLFTDQNTGDASGHTASLAFRGGFDIKAGQYMTGPILGAIFQEAHIDGFTETGTTGTTALLFDNQTRDSQITHLGWRGSIELGAWKPFAEATWNHEWNHDDRAVTTTLTSLSAPSFTSLAVPVASDWGNATIGVSYKINPSTVLWTTFSDVFGSSEMTKYSGELGLRISF